MKKGAFKSIIMLLCVVLGVFVFAACGQKEEASSGPAADERTWIIAGSFTGAALRNNNWGRDGRLNADKYAFVPVEGEFNTFELTVDLYVDDVFQFGVFDYPEGDGGYGCEWAAQKGFGCIVSPSGVFEDLGDPNKSHIKAHDIGVKREGKYRFVMKTDVADDHTGDITWERLGDAAELELVYTPTIMGTFNGYSAGTDAAPEYYFKRGATPLEWSVEVSLNVGDLVFVLPFNNYSVQLNKDRIVPGDAFSPQSYHEIKMASTGKFRFKLDIDQKVYESSRSPYSSKNYTVSAERIGDYEKGAKENEYTVQYRSASEGTDYTVYLKNGARFPDFVAPTLAEGSALMGWHIVGGGRDGANAGIANENTYSANGSTGAVISYGVTTAAERDTRVFWIKGTGGTCNGSDLDNWSNYVDLEQTGDHEYTAILVLDADIRQLQVCENYLGAKTGTYLRGGNVVGYGTLEYLDATQPANIVISQNGTYTLVLDSMTYRITLTKTA